MTQWLLSACYERFVVVWSYIRSSPPGLCFALNSKPEPLELMSALLLHGMHLLFVCGMQCLSYLCISTWTYFSGSFRLRAPEGAVAQNDSQRRRRSITASEINLERVAGLSSWRNGGGSTWNAMRDKSWTLPIRPDHVSAKAP